MYPQLIEKFIQQEKLPASYAEDASQCFLPLIRDLTDHLERSSKRPFVLGINGAQGTGKSTMAKLLAILLEDRNYRVANLSIDDFYYSKAWRESLASTVHPLLRSRGVPGTHDVSLALSILNQLSAAGAGDSIRIPGFDKAHDDCLANETCRTVCGPIDVIIFEGWFVGVTPQTEKELQQPLNRLESDEDSDRRWRNYTNQQLAGDYQTLFAQFDMLLMLKAPDFEQVFAWRSLQEQKLRAKTEGTATELMDGNAIQHFIQHFERLTRHCLLILPDKADRVFILDEQHRIHCSP
jgi:D-glycerate 3-kinase